MTAGQIILAAGFITPGLALAGAALMAIPIVIHFLNRRRFKTVPWAAMEFLLRAMRKNRRWLKFEQWTLLAVRCLLLLLAGIALARPTGCDNSPVAAFAGSRSGLHILVIDNSYSMAYRADRGEAHTHLDQAKRLATGLIDRLGSGGESVAIITASLPAASLLAAPTYDLVAAKEAVERVPQSYRGTDLPGALTKALEVVRQSSGVAGKHVYVLSDATRSAWDAPGAESSLPELARQLTGVAQMTHFSLAAAPQFNRAAVDVRPTGGLVTTRFPADLSAQVAAFGTSEDEAMLQWRLDDQPLATAPSLRLEASPNLVTQPNVTFKTGGPHVVCASLSGNAQDRLDIDDTRWRVVDVAAELKVLIVEGERGRGRLDGSGATLAMALAPPSDTGDGTDASAQRTHSYVAPELISDLELSNKVLSDYRAVALTGVAQIAPQQADQLELFVRNGGTLLVFMGEPVDRESYNEVLVPRRLLPGPLAKRVSAPAERGFLLDFKPNADHHPLLDLFERQEKTGLDTAEIFTYWQVEPRAELGVETVLRYLPHAAGRVGEPSAADPAITLHALGAGHVVFYSTTANYEWTTLTLKPVYVELMHELLAGSVRSGDEWLNLAVGQSLVIPAGVRMTAAPTLIDPQNKQVAVEQSRQPSGPSDGRRGGDRYKSGPFEKPGIYTLATGAASLPVAVNLPAEEADVRTIDDAAIRKRLGDVEITLLGDELPDIAAVAEQQHDYGWPVMLLVLALLGFECFMAMRFGHYAR